MTYEDAIQSCGPMGSKILCQPVRDEELGEYSSGGIIIPDTSKALHQRHLQAEIVEVGPDVVEPALLPGLRVIVRRYSKNYVGESDEYFLVTENDVEAVLAS